MVHKPLPNGFVFIGLLVAIVIIAILCVLYLKGDKNSGGAVQQKQSAEKSLEQTNKNLENYQRQINKNDE